MGHKVDFEETSLPDPIKAQTTYLDENRGWEVS